MKSPVFESTDLPLSSSLPGAPAGYLLPLVQVAVEHGYDQGELERRFDFTFETLTDAGRTVDRELYLAIVDYLYTEGNIPGMGLLQGCRIKPTDHGFVGTAMICSDNLDMAVELAMQYQPLFAMTGRHYALRKPDNSLAIIHEEPYHVQHRICEIECCLVSWYLMINYCVGADARLRAVHLDYPDPGYKELYDKIFRCPVLFEQERTELLIPATLCDIPFTGVNSSMRELCERQCRAVLDALLPSQSLVTKVEGIILKSLHSPPRREAIADQLGMCVRTLQRKLGAENTGYRQIVEQLRRRLAEEYLLETHLAPKRIAHQLGYTDPSNFYHAFSRWYGCTPTQYRARHLS